MRRRAAITLLPLLFPLSLVLLSPATAQDPELEAQVAHKLNKLKPEIAVAIDRGAQYLIGEQLLDGTWDFATPMYPSGQTALCVYTLLKAKVPRGHAAVQQGLAAMLARPPEETYAAACQLLALEASSELVHLRAMQPIVDKLLDWQEKGLWSYPAVPGPGIWGKGKGEVDLSNTQLAMLGLRAALLAEVEIPERTWRSALDGLPRFQGKTKKATSGTRSSTGSTGFRYEIEYRFPATGSMTVGAIGSLKLALDALGDRARGKERRVAEQQITHGLGWLSDHWTIVTNPVEGGELGGGAGPGESWYLYYLYGLERLGAFLDTEWIGGHHWYYEGSRHLVATQEEEGFWGERHEEGGVLGTANRDLPDTCFAVLFLTRASHGGSTLSGPSKAKPIVMDDPSSDVHFRAIPGNPLTLWVSGFSPRVLQLYGEGGKRLRVARVEYLIDGEVAQAVPGDPRRAWRPEQRFETRHRFNRVGARELRVRVGLVPADADRAMLTPDRWIESLPVELAVEQVLEPWMVELAELPLRNLLPELRAQATASSSDGDESDAARAIDGQFATRWMCGPADETPWLRIECKRPKPVDTLILCQGARRASEAERMARITQVRVRINGDEPALEVALTEDPREPTLIALPSEEPLRTLEVFVSGRDRGESAYRRVGFTEISLERRAPPEED